MNGFHGFLRVFGVVLVGGLLECVVEDVCAVLEGGGVWSGVVEADVGSGWFGWEPFCAVQGSFGRILQRARPLLAGGWLLRRLLVVGERHVALGGQWG